MKKLEKALDSYYVRFGENYPLQIASTKEENEIITDIERCINTNTKAVPPIYDDDLIY